jgi:hydroxymethylpyrimidine/phosphomethylpyrimidine kinase
VAAAKEFITAAIRNGLALGKGCGPANPMAFRTSPEKQPL